jgi:hypothetical protein
MAFEYPVYMNRSCPQSQEEEPVPLETETIRRADDVVVTIITTKLGRTIRPT